MKIMLKNYNELYLFILLAGKINQICLKNVFKEYRKNITSTLIILKKYKHKSKKSLK